MTVKMKTIIFDTDLRTIKLVFLIDSFINSKTLFYKTTIYRGVKLRKIQYARLKIEKQKTDNIDRQT